MFYPERFFRAHHRNNVKADRPPDIISLHVGISGRNNVAYLFVRHRLLRFPEGVRASSLYFNKYNSAVLRGYNVNVPMPNPVVSV